MDADGEDTIGKILAAWCEIDILQCKERREKAGILTAKYANHAKKAIHTQKQTKLTKGVARIKSDERPTNGIARIHTL